MAVIRIWLFRGDTYTDRAAMAGAFEHHDGCYGLCKINSDILWLFCIVATLAMTPRASAFSRDTWLAMKHDIAAYENVTVLGIASKPPVANRDINAKGWIHCNAEALRLASV